MMRGSGLGEPERRGEVTNAQLFEGERFYDSQACRVGQRRERFRQALRGRFVSQAQLDATDTLRVDGGNLTNIDRIQDDHYPNSMYERIIIYSYIVPPHTTQTRQLLIRTFAG